MNGKNFSVEQTQKLFSSLRYGKSKTEEEHFTLGTANKKIQNLLDLARFIPTVGEECYDTTEAALRKIYETTLSRWIMKKFFSSPDFSARSPGTNTLLGDAASIAADIRRERRL